MQIIVQERLAAEQANNAKLLERIQAMEVTINAPMSTH